MEGDAEEENVVGLNSFLDWYRKLYELINHMSRIEGEIAYNIINDEFINEIREDF